jgi:hypothetical protein
MAFETPDKGGRVHAVRSTAQDRSRCGRQVLSFAGRPWPMARRLWPTDLERPCPECSRQVYDEASCKTAASQTTSGTG